MSDAAGNNLPDIIRAAAESTLGIVALMVSALGLLAYFFFRHASEKVRIGIFLVLVAGVASFVWAVQSVQLTLTRPHDGGDRPKLTQPAPVAEPRPNEHPGPSKATPPARTGDQKDSAVKTEDCREITIADYSTIPPTFRKEKRCD